MENIQTNDPNKTIKRTIYNGNTDWVAIRSKYFISSLIVHNTNNSFATLSAKNTPFGQRKQTPLYSTSIGFPFGQDEILATLYLGPLDIDYIGIDSNTDLKEGYNRIIKLLKPYTKSKVKLFFKKAENVDFSKLGKYDYVFTSPPYEYLEAYENMKNYENI